MKYLGHKIDFRRPQGAEALVPADSLTWQVFKNPMTMAIGGIAAVLLELAEPRVRSGVWNYSNFENKPFRRMIRTSFAAFITVYAPRETAQSVIQDVRRMHGVVHGTTPDGLTYHANDPELLRWVHVTASFGFIESYSRFARPLETHQKSQIYSEAIPVGELFGAKDLPRNVAEQEQIFADMLPRLEPSQIVEDFLRIVQKALPVPWPLSGMIVRGAISIVPEQVREVLGLQDRQMNARDERWLKRLARLADKVPVPFSPPAQARKRLAR